MAAHPPELDFCRLRHIPIEQVLAGRGLLATLRCRGKRLVGPCPVHGGDNPTAFVVNRHDNTWYCFTGCSSGGDVVELVRRLEGGYRRAAVYLASLAGAQSYPPLPPPPPPPPPAAASDFVPFTRRLPLDPHADLLTRKGIRPDTARRFEAGAYHGRGFLAGCVGVRLHDHRGRPLGYLARRLDPEQARRRGKYKLPPALPKSRLLYNLHRTCAIQRSSSVLVPVCHAGTPPVGQRAQNSQEGREVSASSRVVPFPPIPEVRTGPIRRPGRRRGLRRQDGRAPSAGHSPVSAGDVYEDPSLWCGGRPGFPEAPPLAPEPVPRRSGSGPRVRRGMRDKRLRSPHHNPRRYSTDRVRRNGLVLVECPWAVMRLAQLRIPAVALLGTHLSDHQLRLLADVPRLLLMLDGDDAGRTAATRIYRQLAPHAAVGVASLPDGLDPDDLPDRLLGPVARHLFLL